MVTTLGKFFDAIADKCLIMTGLILVIAAGIKGNSPVVTPTWAGIACVVVILAREFMVSALRQIAAAKGVVLAADKGGKIKATVQFIVVSFYMFLAFYLTDIDKLITDRAVAEQVSGSLRFILIIFLVGTALITVYTGASYVIRNRFLFTEAGGYKKEENGPVHLADDEILEEVEEDDEHHKNDVEYDELLPKALKLCIENNLVSATFIQKKLGISWSRASKIIDQMEERAYISGVESNRRKVYMSIDEFNEIFGDVE